MRSAEWADQTVSLGSCAEFRVPSAEQRFWSPQLSVQAEPESDGNTRLHCRYSPRPEVWTLCMFVYSLGAFGICAAAMAGYVQWTLNSTPWAWVGVPVGVALIAAVHGASLVGQTLSRDQMEMLRERLDMTIDRSGLLAGPAS